MIAAAEDLAGGMESEPEMKAVVVLSFFSIIVFGAITLVKFQLANKLDSISMYKDGVCSLIGTVLASGVFATTLIIEKDPSLWKLDPLFAICCGCTALFLGAHAIYDAAIVQGTPIFTSSWWLVSGDDGVTDGLGGEGNTVEMTDPDNIKLSEVV